MTRSPRSRWLWCCAGGLGRPCGVGPTLLVDLLQRDPYGTSTALIALGETLTRASAAAPRPRCTAFARVLRFDPERTSARSFYQRAAGLRRASAATAQDRWRSGTESSRSPRARERHGALGARFTRRPRREGGTMAVRIPQRILGERVKGGRKARWRSRDRLRELGIHDSLPAARL
jgi:hypothetical protein